MRLRCLAGQVEPGFLEQHMDFEQVGHRLRHRDDVMRDAPAPIFGMRLGRGADDRQLGRGLFRIVGIGAGQRPRAFQLAAEQRDARVLVERGIIVADAAGLEQLGDDALVDRAVLAHVERREMEAEGLDRADQPAERAAAGERAGALRRPARARSRRAPRAARAGSA